MPAMDAYYEAEYLRDGDPWFARGVDGHLAGPVPLRAISRASVTMRKAAW
ncbi:MAG: hypothetical protein ACLSVD_07470 [Eggerthellaceae bacterium]